jgi:hypothetical protein
LAGWAGVTVTVLIGGVACLVGAALFGIQIPRLRAMVRPIYVKLGIVPEIATGLQAAAESVRPPKD